MDGTLLDLHFDNVFFQETVPQAYANKNGLDLESARTAVLAAYQQDRGTLAWYDLDHWSRLLGLDIPLLKEEVAHLIQVHPHVLPFLAAVQASGRPAYLVTNAHAHSLQMKLARTPIGRFLTAALTSHELGKAKEEAEFWPLLERRLGFDPATTLLVDDSEPVLGAAQAYGIAHLRHMANPSSRLPPQRSDHFFSVLDFRELALPVGESLG
ncbi:MAG: HAD-IA family hydrolase [Magnetococcales bacterium]|nr:HAD-IA family hydrolase [Magnetococcales bacterium]MBF0439585.1 HAD-IA family hydrolase [Magnetococcales bacterium]